VEDDGKSAMRCACIDIGSNTTRLLVAEAEGAGLREVHSERVFLRLGRAVEPGGAIPGSTIERLADTVAAQVALGRALGAERIRTVATAALRGSVNRDAVLRAVARTAKVRVEVLTGEEEARLAFAGATGTLEEATDGRIGVADIGGGSSELVVGTLRGGVEWWRSLAIGSGLLAERTLPSDPPREAELEAAREEAVTAFEGLTPLRAELALAVGGSAASLRALCGPVLDAATLDEALATVVEGPAEQVAGRLGLHPERVRVLPAGLLLLREAAALFGAPLQVARGGLREGVLLQSLYEAGAFGYSASHGEGG
jgi:exopolyphosphatase / guanosine-5'-triphosphate,3'-diphosphate pyrophosphatase